MSVLPDIADPPTVLCSRPVLLLILLLADGELSQTDVREATPDSTV